MRVSDNYKLMKYINLYRNSYLSAYGDKPHLYLFGGTLFVVAGFIPANEWADYRKKFSIRE